MAFPKTRLAPLNPIRVQLTWEQMTEACRVGLDRQLDSMAKGDRANGGFKNNPDGFAEVEIHMIGAVGEYACAMALGLEWDKSVGTYKEPDLPMKIQVRTRTKKSYNLLVRPDDKPEHIFVLVKGNPFRRDGDTNIISTDPRTFEITGWAYAKDIKVQAFYDEKIGGEERGKTHPGFWPADNCLRCPSELVNLTAMPPAGLPVEMTLEENVPYPDFLTNPAIIAMREAAEKLAKEKAKDLPNLWRKEL